MKQAVRFLSFCCLLTIIILPVAFGQKRTNSQSGKKGIANQIDTLANKHILKVEAFRLEIIPPASGVQFYRYGLVFLSNSKTEGKMLKSHTSFGNVEAYYAAFQDSSLGRHELFSNQGTFDVPCEGMTFNRDYTEMYYSKRQGKMIRKRSTEPNTNLLKIIIMNGLQNQSH